MLQRNVFGYCDLYITTKTSLRCVNKARYRYDSRRCDQQSRSFAKREEYMCGNRLSKGRLFISLFGTHELIPNVQKIFELIDNAYSQ